MDKIGIALVAFIGVIGLALGLGLLLSLPVYWLWNGCLVDAVTVCKPITWLQAFGLTVLCSFLFKSSTSSSSN
jgi:hypothetical protein